MNTDDREGEREREVWARRRLASRAPWSAARGETGCDVVPFGCIVGVGRQIDGRQSSTRTHTHTRKHLATESCCSCEHNARTHVPDNVRERRLEGRRDHLHHPTDIGEAEKCSWGRSAETVTEWGRGVTVELRNGCGCSATYISETRSVSDRTSNGGPRA